MDQQIRNLQRLAVANPTDVSIRASLAAAERRTGKAIGSDVEPDALKRILTAPWVCTPVWGAIRTGFRSIVLVRPGALGQISGYNHYYFGIQIHPGVQSLITIDHDSESITPCLVGRTEVGNGVSKVDLLEFNEDMIKWAAGNCATKINNAVHETMSIERRKETWSIEHVRLHCGLDPICRIEERPKPKPKAKKQVRVSTCHACRSSQGRERVSGDVFCYNCNLEIRGGIE